MGGTQKIDIPWHSIFFEPGIVLVKKQSSQVVVCSSHYDWNDSPIYHDNVL